MKTPFDPTRAVAFDLARGVVEGSGERLLVVPATLVAEIAHAAGPAAARAAARAIGEACGTRIAARLGGAERVRAAPIEEVLSHVAGELAVCGLGTVELERWGRALVVAVAYAAFSDDAWVAALVEGAVGAATERTVAARALVREGGRVRVLVTGPTAAERADKLLAEGTAWGEVLAQIQVRGEA